MMLPPLPDCPQPPFGASGLSRLYEGEGTIITTARHGPRTLRCSLHMRIQMTDEDVLLAIKAEFGGSLCPVTRSVPRLGAKPTWQWDINGWRAAALGWQMLPYLFSRRREQMAAALTLWLANRTPEEEAVVKFLGEIGYQYDPGTRKFTKGCTQ